MAQLICDSLKLGYDGRAILEDITFSVEAGDYLCILGENGVGKSTLINTLLGLKKPLSGNILSGDGLHSWNIGYLPQQTEVQKDFPASVEEVVTSGTIKRKGFHPFCSAAQKEQALQAMERLGIADIRRKCYRDLSGGQQQRVLLARALCAAEKMILLDEPAAGLDPVVTAELYGQIAELNRQGVTVIMVSHDISSALKYANKILHLGSEVFFGTPEEYLGSEVGRSFTSEKLSRKERTV